MTRFTRSLLSLLLVFCLSAAAFPIPAEAGDYADAPYFSGTCGDNLTWVLDDCGTLTISGTGEMWGSPDFETYRSNIKPSLSKTAQPPSVSVPSEAARS